MRRRLIKHRTAAEIYYDLNNCKCFNCRQLHRELQLLHRELQLRVNDADRKLNRLFQRKIKFLKLNKKTMKWIVNAERPYYGTKPRTVGDLVYLEEAEVLKLPNFGLKSLHALLKELDRHGLHLGMDVPKHLLSATIDAEEAA